MALWWGPDVQKVAASAQYRHHEAAKTAAFRSCAAACATVAGPAIALPRRVSFQKSQLAQTVIGLAIEVHRTLGPGLIESIYRRCLVHELRAAGVRVGAEVTLPVRYKDLILDHVYRADLIIEETLLVEIKSVECLLPIHTAQTLTYLKVSGLRQALLFNFNECRLVDGLRSVVN